MKQNRHEKIVELIDIYEIETQEELADKLLTGGSADPAAARKEKLDAYRAEFATPYQAAKRGYVDDVIEPSATRQMLCAAVEMLSGKRDTRPAKKHGNMPL